MQPLTPDAVDAVRTLCSEADKPCGRVFAKFVGRDLDQFKKDLKAADIPYVDARDEYADFHSLRKTYGTSLTLAGVGLVVLRTTKVSSLTNCDWFSSSSQ